MVHLADRHTSVPSLDELFSRCPAHPPMVDPGRPVVLYGAGQLGRLALAFCRQVGVTVLYVLDRNAVPGQLLNGGVPVLQAAPPRGDPNCPILVAIATSAYSPIARQLRECGWTHVLPFYDYAQHFALEHPLNNGWFSGTLEPEDRSAIQRVFNKLADTRSRSSYTQFLAWRVLREELIFPEALIDTADRYFIHPVRACLGSAEDVIDVGAYDGRFLLHLLNVTNGAFSSALLFEPDVENAALLRRALAPLFSTQQSKVELRAEAVAEATGTAAFCRGFDMVSRLSPAGKSTIATVKIDDFGVSPTYLKVHVEGGELGVLRGAAHTLRQSRPMIAATIYHNRDGLWKTPLFLMRLLEQYDFFFRLHGWCGTGAVMYAVPQERWRV